MVNFMKKLNFLKVIFIILSCLSLFIIGSYTATLTKNNGYNKQNIYNNINIYTYKDFNTDNYDKYLKDLETIPYTLLKNCKNIYFTNENLTEKFDLNIKTKIVAISYGNDIYINTSYHGEDVLIHEMYHVFDYCNNWISETKEFKELYKKYNKEIEVSPGNINNEYEFFATCGEIFSLNKEKINNKEIYTFFSNLNIQP